MQSQSSYTRGFSLLEILISLAILILITSITMYSFSAMRAKKQLEIATDSLSFKLEEAKAYALTGKGGTNFGVAFPSTTTYVYFVGSTYSISSLTNATITLPLNLRIATSLSSGASTISFSRLTGASSATGTITLTDITRSMTTATVTIGTLGDISVIK